MDGISTLSAYGSSPASRREAVELQVIRQTVQAEQAVAQVVAQSADALKAEIPAVPRDQTRGTVVDRRI